MLMNVLRLLNFTALIMAVIKLLSLFHRRHRRHRRVELRDVSSLHGSECARDMPLGIDDDDFSDDGAAMSCSHSQFK